jgi:hypothetical protein
MTKVWLEAGFKTEQVDIAGRKLVFRRVKPLPPARQDFSEERNAAPTNPAHASQVFHPAYGSMKGLIQVAPGVDLTKPADSEWGKVYE